MPSDSFYTATQAAGIAFAFALLDVAMTLLGLAWNGRYFTLDNIRYWFQLDRYSFTVNPIDFLVS